MCARIKSLLSLVKIAVSEFVCLKDRMLRQKNIIDGIEIAIGWKSVDGSCDDDVHRGLLASHGARDFRSRGRASLGQGQQMSRSSELGLEARTPKNLQTARQPLLIVVDTKTLLSPTKT